MADTLAQLDIQITSSAKASMDAIDAVQKKVNALGTAMTALSSPWAGTALSSFSKSIKDFANDVNAVDINKIKPVASVLRNLGTAADKLSSSSSAAANLAVLANELERMSSMKFGDFSNITKFLNSAARLGETKAGSVGTALSSMATGLGGVSSFAASDFDGITKLLNAVRKIDSAAVANMYQVAIALRGFTGITISDMSGISSLFNSISKVSSSGFNPRLFNDIGVAVRSLASGLVGTPQVSENLLKLLSALARFSSASMENAPAHIDEIGSAISRMITYLDDIPTIRDDILRFVEAIAAIAPHMRSMTTSVGSASSGFNLFDTVVKAAKDSLKEFIGIGKKAIETAKNVFKSLMGGKGLLSGPVGSLLRFAATFLTIQRAWEALKNSISNASALVEIQNVINAVYSSGERAFTGLAGEAQTAAEHLDELAKGAINAYGMSELAFKEYASQFQAMGTALGITNEQVAAAEANLEKWGVMVSKVKDPVTGLNKEFGTMTGQMSDMSMTMTQLAGDIASFYDKDVSEVQKMLASGIYAGQTRPLTLAA